MSADLPWDDYLTALRPQGKLCVVGLQDKPIEVSAISLLLSEEAVVSGIPGSLVETSQMPAFTARHGIKPATETFSMTEADRALDHTARARRGSGPCS